MRKIALNFILTFFVITTSVHAQKTEVYAHQLTDFDKAVSLYNEKQYVSAQLLFDKVKKQNPTDEIAAECVYYSAFCAIKLNQNDAEFAMEKFVADYPTSSKQNQAYIGVSHYYFEQGNFQKPCSILIK